MIAWIWILINNKNKRILKDKLLHTVMKKTTLLMNYVMKFLPILNENI